MAKNRAIVDRRKWDTRAARAGKKVVRSLFRDSSVTKAAERAYTQRTRSVELTRRKTKRAEILIGHDRLVVVDRDDPQPRRGIYLWGGCDLPSAFHMEDELASDPRGSVAIVKPPGASLGTCSSAITMQTLDDLPEEPIRRTLDELSLPETYFDPVAFAPEFQVEGAEMDPFPKSVIILSLGAEIIRKLNRHTDADFLVDPGGAWLRTDEGGTVKHDRISKETSDWFFGEFEPVRRATVDVFAERYRRLIPELKRRTGAEIMVFNTLTIEPGDRTHNFQLRRTPEGARRRQFHIATAELSEELGFHIVDVDRILKVHGVTRQIDFAHFPNDLMGPVAQDIHRQLRELEIV